MKIRRPNGDPLTLEFCELAPGDKFYHKKEICVAMDYSKQLKAVGLSTGRVYQMEWHKRVMPVSLAMEEPAAESLRPLFDEDLELQPGMIAYNDQITNTKCPEEKLYVITSVWYEHGRTMYCECVNLYDGEHENYDYANDWYMRLVTRDDRPLTREFLDLAPGDKFYYKKEICVATEGTLVKNTVTGLTTGNMYLMKRHKRVLPMSLRINGPKDGQLWPMKSSMTNGVKCGDVVYDSRPRKGMTQEKRMSIVTYVSYDGACRTCSIDCVNLVTGMMVRYELDKDPGILLYGEASAEATPLGI